MLIFKTTILQKKLSGYNGINDYSTHANNNNLNIK